MTKLKSMLIMAGGTGGHVFPGLAVAKYAREKDITVTWLGTRQGLEAQWVTQAGFPIYFINIRGLRGKGLKDILFFPWRLGFAILQSLQIIRKLNPDIVLGMGGFVSGPGGIACWLLGKKLVIHEQNAKPGLTNRWLAKVAIKVLEGFPNTFKKHHKVLTTGNPVRNEMTNLPTPSERFNQNTQVPHLLIFGGSLGAEAFNRLLPGALAKLDLRVRPEVWHQTGQKYFEDTLRFYKNTGVNAQVVPFIQDMDTAYTWADVVLCRAGALTVAELCAVGLGAILVPFPHAVDDHQTANANYMVKQQAAILIQQAELNEDILAKLLQELCGSTEKRYAMAQAAYQLRKVDATEKVFTICEEVCL